MSDNGYSASFCNYFLNCKPTQFTRSKTKTAIEYINHVDASRCDVNTKGEHGIHHMNIICTNNSKIDGRQWSCRLRDDNSTRHISILSSDRKRAQFSKVGDFFAYCTQIDKPDNLIDVLVVCTNNIRTNDIKDIIKTLDSGRINLENIGINKFKFTVMFDEVDKPANLTNALEFIEYSKKFSCIDSIHLITASAYDKFWKRIKKIGLNTLKNLRHEIREIESAEVLIENYRKLEDHNIKYVVSTLESDEYIKEIYNKHISDKEYPLRLFAPPSRYTETHDSVKKFFLEKGFIVIVINGKEKSIYLDGEPISIDNFNKNHFPKKTDVEMYKTLTKLNNLYTNTNIVITGFDCIERGVTFQTNGFNFTDMIIPPIQDDATAVQMVGRANGGKNFVKKHNIWIQKSTYDKIKKRVDKTLNLIESNPIEVCETDFREKTDKERDMVRWEVPLSIDLQKEEFEYVTEKKGVRFARERTLELFKKNDINIEGYDHAMWNCPKPDTRGYRKNILPLLNAISENKPISLLHRKDKDKNKKIYSVYFDTINHKVILVKYNGDIKIE